MTATLTEIPDEWRVGFPAWRDHRNRHLVEEMHARVSRRVMAVTPDGWTAYLLERMGYDSLRCEIAGSRTPTVIVQGCRVVVR